MEACLQKGKPALSKPVTGELGCTTPYIIVPGAWSRGDLEYHARGIFQMPEMMSLEPFRRLRSGSRY